MGKTVSDYKKDYAKAYAKNDKAGMANAHAGADSVRGYKTDASGTTRVSTPSSSSSNKSSSSGSSGGGSGYNYGTTINQKGSALDNFYNDNASRINGLATTNGVDLATAKSMLVSNILGTGKYAGAGVANMSDLYKEYNNALNSDRSTNYGANTGANTGTNTGVVNTPMEQVQFDEDAYKQQKLDALIAELTGQYNTNSANLDKTYNTNVSTANKQIEDVKGQYLDTINQLDEDTYNAYKLANQRASARGLTNSNQGEAMLNTIAVNSSKQRADVNSDRDSTINDIQTKINELGANYGIDNDTLEKNFGSDRLKAMSQTELEAIQMKLDTSKYNVDWANKYKLQDYTNQFTAKENQLNRDTTNRNADNAIKSNEKIAQLDNDTKKWISQLDNDTQKYVAGLSASAQTACARIGASSSLATAKYTAQLASSDQAFANKLALAGLQFTTAVNNGMNESEATAKYIAPVVKQ